MANIQDLINEIDIGLLPEIVEAIESCYLKMEQEFGLYGDETVFVNYKLYDALQEHGYLEMISLPVKIDDSIMSDDLEDGKSISDVWIYSPTRRIELGG